MGQCQGHAMPWQAMPRPRHALARHAKATPCQASNSLTFSKCLEWGNANAKACQGQGTTCQRKPRPRQAEATTRQSQSHDKPKVSEGGAKRKQVRKNTSKCRMGSLAKFWGKVEWKRRGRDESKRRRAESQWIVAARPLCHLQYPVAYLSRLQRILPAAR